MIGIQDSNQKIVGNNLLLNLDAGQLRSYPTTGTVWTDLSGNNTTGTLTNGPTFNSANGGSIFTDGTNDFVSTPLAGAGSATANYTFSAWFNNNNYSEDKYILCRGRDGFGSGWSLLLAVNTLGKARAGAATTSPSVVGTETAGTSTLALNTWYYITGLWTASTSIKVYVNGVLEGTALATGRTNLRTSTNGFVLGSITNTNFTSGYTAAVHVYNIALTDAQILNNFNASKSRFGY